MKIYDMFSKHQTALHAKGFCLTEFPVEQENTQYLLFCPAAGILHLKHSITVKANPYPVYGLVYVTEGTLTYRSQMDLQNSVAVNEGTLYLFDCRTSHTLSTKGDCSFTILYFDGSPAAYYCNRLLSSEFFLPTACTGELALKLQNILTCTAEDTMLRHLALSDFLTSLVCHTTPSAARIPAYLLEIKKLLDTDYYTNHTLEELETTYKTDRYRICREFKLHFQISPIQYLHQVRMKNAQLLLREKDMKIHEIAYEVGYENVNHFIHHFKKTAGTTPTEYRKNLFVL